MMDDEQMRQLGEGLAALCMTGLGIRSFFALKTAIESATIDGVTGVLVVRIPSKVKDYCEIDFTVGTVDGNRWGK